MRLGTQVLWIASVSSVICVVYPFAVDRKSDLSDETDPSRRVQIEIEEDEDEDDSDEETETEPSIEFDDFVDLDALAKGVLGPENKQDTVVPCFGTWWPSGGYGGYVYYYDDYGSDGGDGESTDEGDYGRRRRNRRRRRRRRMRNRSRRSRAKKSAKKKS